MDEFKQIIIIAVVLLILVGAIVIALRINNTAQGVVEEQEQNLINAMNRLDESKLLTYDNKQIEGTQVLAAVEGYRGADLAVFVVTKAQGAAAGAASWSTGINYNCQIGSNDSSTDPSAAMGETGDMPDDPDSNDYYLANGRFELTASLSYETAQLNNYKFAKDKSSECYINPRGKFQSFVCVNPNGQIIGIAMYQIR